MERSVEVRVFLIAPNIPPLVGGFCYDNGIIALDTDIKSEDDRRGGEG